MSAKNKPNGHTALLAKGSGAAADTISLSGMGQAASVDASELPVANAAPSSAVASAGRKACADVAQVQGEGEWSPATGTASQSPSREGGNEGTVTASDRRRVLPGVEPLPIDEEAFVDAVHAQVDLVQLEVDLLSSKDDKIAQRELAYLRELRYGKRAPSADDGPQQFIFDAPRPERDMP